MENLKEELLKLRTNKQIVYYDYLNGEITPQKRKYATDLNLLNKDFALNIIDQYILDALRTYAYRCDFDLVKANLSAGLVYKPNDIENDTIKLNARPYDNIACFEINSVRTYLDGEQSNDKDYVSEINSYRGYALYNELVKGLKERGFVFDGPESFEDLKNAVLYGQDFNIDISMDLSLDKEKTLTLKK